jgi:thermitase
MFGGNALYLQVKTLTFTAIIGLLLIAVSACSQPELSDVNNPDRAGNRAIEGKVIAGDNASLLAIEQLRLDDRILPLEISLKFKDDVSKDQRDIVLSKYNLTVTSEIPKLGFLRVTLARNASLTGTIESLQAEDSVDIAEPIFRTYAKQIRVTPNDLQYDQQSYLNVINAPEGWFIEPGSDLANIPPESDVVIAVLDTGIDMNHPDLMPSPGTFDGFKIISGWNFVDGIMDVSDGHGHGTLVTGILGAIANNAIGIAGVAWNPRIIPIKVLDNDGIGDSFRTAEAIMFALGRFNDIRDQGNPYGPNDTIFDDPFNAKMIINMSFGYEVSNVIGESQIEANAIEACNTTNDVICVAAAGDDSRPINNGSSSIYPAANHHVVKVGAIDYANNLLSTSNMPSTTELLDSQPFVVAPGYNIFSTFPTDFSEGYGVGNGTSFAAPQVSGLLALIWSQFPFLRADEVLTLLKESSNADAVGGAGIDATTGWGLINCLLALQRSYHPNPTNQPIVVKAFTNPILHGDIIFVVKSRYRLMDPVESPIYFDTNFDPPLVITPNGGRAISYEVGYDTNDDGAIEDPIPVQVSVNGEPMYFPNNLQLIQFSDNLYVGRVHLFQDVAPTLGTLLIRFTGVPQDFRRDPAIPMSVSGETTIEITGFHNS